MHHVPGSDSGREHTQALFALPQAEAEQRLAGAKRGAPPRSAPPAKRPRAAYEIDEVCLLCVLRELEGLHMSSHRGTTNYKLRLLDANALS